MFNAGSISFSSGLLERHEITISTGTVTVDGECYATSSTVVLPSFTGASRLKLGGSMYTPSDWVPGLLTGSMLSNGSRAQTVQAFSYKNLILSGGNLENIGSSHNCFRTLSVKESTILALYLFCLRYSNHESLVGGAVTGASITGSGALTLGGNITTTDATDRYRRCQLLVAPVVLGAATITVADDGTSATDLTMSGIISGAFAITKSGTGILLFSGANTYSGSTTISWRLRLNPAADSTPVSASE